MLIKCKDVKAGDQITNRDGFLEKIHELELNGKWAVAHHANGRWLFMKTREECVDVLRECPYCERPLIISGGDVIYPHREDLRRLKFYHCAPCDAYVSTKIRNGTLSNHDLREAKKGAHRAFDSVWKSGRMSRTKAYKELAERLNIVPDKCHIGQFDIEMCQKVMMLTWEK